ncbi:FHA domain-containing protein, partial [Dickeya sp. DW 0440]
MFELRVLTGLHRGAALPLSGTAWRIGCADEADMVLYDPGIRDQHCLLEQQPQGWLLSSLDGPVSNGEGHALTEPLLIQPGTPFAAGGIWLCVVSADTPWQDEETAASPTETPPQSAPEVPADPDEPSLVAPPSVASRPAKARLP